STAASGAASTSARTTFMRSAAKRWASARPMPLPAPVTTAVRPAKSRMPGTILAATASVKTPAALYVAGGRDYAPAASLPEGVTQHARRHGSHLPEPTRRTLRSRRLPRRPASRGARGAARLRFRLGRRAPLHGLHDVSRRARVPHLHRRPDAAHPARLDGGRSPLARPAARRRAGGDARPHERRPVRLRHRP